ncbi:MAG: undecaprenyl-phosphate glucose phosphotransferase, partial [Alphaproteobacteria bacterium]|nr:undecaprenyl-phosphate glucose phosphotransferase [Alphaproteobacteria bacterium]
MTEQGVLKCGLEENLFDFIRLVDFIVLASAAFLAYYLRHDHLFMELSYVSITALGIAAFFAAAHSFTLYKYRNFHSFLRQAVLIMLSVCIGVFSCVLLLFMMKISGDFSRLWMGYWLLLGLGSLLISRLFLLVWFKGELKKGHFVRKTVLVGSNPRALSLLERINEPNRTNVTVLAIYMPKGEKEEEKINLPKITQLKDLIAFCDEHDVDDVIITTDISQSEKTDKLLEDLRSLPCHVRYCLPSTLFDRGLINHIWGAPVISIYRRPLDVRQVRLKRLLDISVAGTALVLLSPVLLTIALLLRLTGQRDVLFRQERNGFAGKTFGVLKFRSMKVADVGTGDVKQATRNDPRVTKLGAILRKTSLDELPQLINVLRGDMSLVGPRPHAVSHNDHYADLIESYLARNRMTPGITGWAQINGWRGETETLDKMEGRVKFDLYFIENWSIWLDIKIL